MRKSNLTSAVLPTVAKTEGFSLPDERILVEQAKSDPRAFGKLFDRYQKRIYRIKKPDDAISLEQNAAGPNLNIIITRSS